MTKKKATCHPSKPRHCKGLCVSCYVNKWSKENPERRKQVLRKARLKFFFGISVEEYEAMLIAQDGKCAICKDYPTTRRLAVDHNHKTSKVRGLLCNACNRGIGTFRDSIALLNSASEYLERTKK